MRLPHFSVALVAACVITGSYAATAQAHDDSPCAKAVKNVPTQLCPLTGLLDGTRVPVHAKPVPHDKGTPRPLARSFAYAQDTSMGKALTFECQAKGALYYHPNDRWFNIWWARTRGRDGRMGWVPEVYFKGGVNNEPDLELRRCQGTSPPPPAEPPCDPTPAVSGVTLRARFSGSRRVVTRGYGRHPRVSGVLSGSDGSPLANASICVGEQDNADAGVRAVKTLMTDANGHVSYSVPTGASRRLWFVHRVGVGAAADAVDVRVRAPVKMRSSRRRLRNGQTTTFRGRIGGGGDRRGLLVELQYPQQGSWHTFATTPANAAGRFHYRYRFTRTLGAHTYRLRARVPEQRGFPFATGASRKVRVRVSG